MDGFNEKMDEADKLLDMVKKVIKDLDVELKELFELNEELRQNDKDDASGSTEK